MNCLDLGNGFKTIKREIIISVSGTIYKENNVFIFEHSFSQNFTSTLFFKVPRLRSFHKTHTYNQVNNMKFMLKNLSEIIIKIIIT